jgi:hypothetical protein
MKLKHLASCLTLLASAAQLEAQGVGGKQTDPMQQLINAFPETVEIKNNGRLLEFCPDGTCDGFVTAGNVSPITLKDFAYLYVYFFSDNTVLDDWRGTEAPKKTADRILGQTEYLPCKSADSREAARCVLRHLSRNGRIRLIFVRYDEGERHAVSESLREKLLSGTSPSP